MDREMWNVMKVIGFALVALACATSVCVAIAEPKVDGARPFPQPYGTYKWDKPPYTEEFKRLVAEGVLALRGGDLEGGIALLYQASRVELAQEGWEEVGGPPNFELWDDIGEAECKRADHLAGLALLQDYRCAVTQTSSDMQCYFGSYPNIVANSLLTPRCFRTMCGDIWKPYSRGIGPAPDDFESVDSGRAEVKRIDKLIKACTLPRTR